MVTQLTVTAGADEFYPTPAVLAEKMLADVDWELVETVLEPSAGKGDLVEAAIRKNFVGKGAYSRRDLNVDCIEIDPHLREILKYNFSAEKRKATYGRMRELDRYYYPSLKKAQQSELDRLKKEIKTFESANVRIIHDDFLSYCGVKKYHLIVMNPPFSNGDKHLLKALEIQRNGGEIVCLLNAETIRNPYTNSRQVLLKQLNKYGAHIQYVKDAFKTSAGAERGTDVEVAIVKVSIPHEQKLESEFWDRMKKAAEYEQRPEQETTEVTLTGFLENITTMYRVEVAASLKLIEEYNALKPYILKQFPKKGGYSSDSAILTLTVGTDSNCLQECKVNKYLKAVRLKYWEALFDNNQFTGNLTSNLQEKYRAEVEKMADYDFTMYNIQTILTEMNSKMVVGVKETILNIFEKLSAEHAHFPECKNNIHLYNGWKTNKAHKVNHKVIIPTRGMFSDFSWNQQTFEVSTAYHVLSDIEKVFNYLDGGMTADVDLLAVLNAANSDGYKQNIECKYFTVSIFKKGTTHIKFKDQRLVDKLNIYAARNKAWLPPSYGKAHYAEMSAEEQAAVNQFQGAEAYAKVMANAGYYLFDASTAVLAIEQKT